MKLYFTALLLLASHPLITTQSLYRERRTNKNTFLGRSFDTYYTISKEDPPDQSNLAAYAEQTQHAPSPQQLTSEERYKIELAAYAEQIRKEQIKINAKMQKCREQQNAWFRKEEEKKAKVRNEIEEATSNTTQQRIIEKNGKILRAFLRGNTDITRFFIGTHVVISDTCGKEVFMSIQLRSSQENGLLYQNQKYEIDDPEYELCGLLGGVLSSLVKLNKKTIGCHYVCRCTSTSTSVILKPESGARDIKALVVPTDRLFDVTVDTIKGKHYLCVYEHPDYKPPVKDGDNDDRWVFIQ